VALISAGGAYGSGHSASVRIIVATAMQNMVSPPGPQLAIGSLPR
jgi:hypothetical protein